MTMSRSTTSTVARGGATQEIQGLAAIRGFQRVVADRRQETDEQSPVEGGVVDDEDAAAGHDAPSADIAASRRSMAVSASLSASGRIGLDR